MFKSKLSLFLLAGIFFSDCRGSENKTAEKPLTNQPKVTMSANTDTITLGGGCFWCIEAVFLNLKGVESATSGYMGGTVKNPTYREVCTGTTGHAEVVQVVYDPKVVSFEEILEVFFTVHDPTTLNRQGNDTGTQYRSAIFYHTQAQKETAERIVAELNKSGAWSNPLVTQIVPASSFYKAENYHQNYYNNNSEAGYCQYVIQPKLEKFRKVFPEKIKK
jgi:peptide-methionine (S)-S-oxide reductase